MESVQDLVGKTMIRVVNNNDEEIVFETQDGETYKLYHEQDCCESVTIEDIAGSLQDLVGQPILKAEEAAGESGMNEYGDMSYTYTFYHFATVNGYVTVRWYGTSNGYYSESVTFCKVS